MNPYPTTPGEVFIPVWTKPPNPTLEEVKVHGRVVVCSEDGKTGLAETVLHGGITYTRVTLGPNGEITGYDPAVRINRYLRVAAKK
jgi:hypothetical protein